MKRSFLYLFTFLAVLSTHGAELPSNQDLIKYFKDSGTNFDYVDPTQGYSMDLAAGKSQIVLLIQASKENQDDLAVIFDKTTGTKRDQWSLGRNSACATAIEGSTLWVLSRSQKKFLRSFDTQGLLVKTFSPSTLPPGKIYGLALSPRHIYFSAYKDNNSTIIQMDRQTLEWVKLVESPGWVASLTWKGSRLWGWRELSEGNEKQIINFDLSTLDNVDTYVSLPGSFMGLDNDGKVFYSMTQIKGGARIKSFGIWENPKLLVSSPKTRKVTYGERFKNANSNAFDLTYFLAKPEDKSFQKVDKLQWNTPPSSFIKDKYGNIWARFDFKGKNISVEVLGTFDLTTWDVQFQPNKDWTWDPGAMASEDSQQWTSETLGFDYSAPIINTMLSQLPQDSLYWDRVISVQNAVNDGLRVDGPSGPQSSASLFLEKGVGRCYAHTLAFGALSRGWGIPTRAIGGVGVDRDQDGEFPPSEDLGVHTWNQVFFPDYGWVDIDTVNNDNPKGRPHSLRYAGFHSGDHWITFVGDYDKQDRKEIFTQRGWISSYTWSSTDKKKKAELGLDGTIIRVKTIK